MREWKAGDKTVYYGVKVEITEEIFGLFRIKSLEPMKTILATMVGRSLLKDYIPTLAERQAALVEKRRKILATRSLEPESIQRDARVQAEEAIKSNSANPYEAWAWYTLITGKLAPGMIAAAFAGAYSVKSDTADRMTEDSKP